MSIKDGVKTIDVGFIGFFEFIKSGTTGFIGEVVEKKKCPKTGLLMYKVIISNVGLSFNNSYENMESHIAVSVQKGNFFIEVYDQEVLIYDYKGVIEKK